MLFAKKGSCGTEGTENVRCHGENWVEGGPPLPAAGTLPLALILPSSISSHVAPAAEKAGGPPALPLPSGFITSACPTKG